MLPTTTSGGVAPLAPSEIVGVAKERVDPYTLQLIDDLFPGHHGITFLAAFLRLAEAKQLMLPEVGVADSADMAVVTAQSIRALAKRMGMAYDTVEKYVVVMSQLQLLLKKRAQHQILFYFPLRLCKLPEPEALDHLQELRPGKGTPRYRAKVRSFADKVKRRFVLLCKGGKTEPAISSPVASLANEPGHFSYLLLEDIRGILRQEVDSETQSRLFLKIEGAVRYRCTHHQSLLSERKGDSESEACSFQQQKSPFGREKGDSEGEPSHSQGLLFSQKGDLGGERGLFQEQKSSFGFGKSDFPHRQGTVEGTLREQEPLFLGREGDSAPERSSHQGLLFPKKGDSEASPLIPLERKATLWSPKGDSLGETSDGQSRLSPKKGDSGREQGIPDEQKLPPFRPKGDFVEPHGASLRKESTFSDQKGDSANTLVPTLNVRNRSFSKKGDSTNVQRELAEELAVCVEGHSGNSTQYERYLASTDSRLVLATYLYVLEEVWSKQRTPKPVKVPGAYFHTMLTAWKKFTSYEAACQAYADAYGELQAKGKTPAPRDRLPGIPTRLQGLVENLYGWSYADVRDELAVFWQRQGAGSTAAFLPTQDAASGQEDMLEPEVPSRWMTTEAEAGALIERIEQEAPIIEAHVERLKIRPYRVRGCGITVFVVDALVERFPQVYAAPSQWDEYFLPLKADLEEEQCKIERSQA